MSFHEAINLQILQLLNQPTVPFLDTYFFPLLSYSIYAYLIFTAFHFFRKRDKETFVHLSIAVIVGFFVATGLKYLFNVPRPFVTFPNNIHALLFSLDPSFPSRHTFIAFLLLRFIPKDFSKIYRYLSIVYLIAIPLTQMHIGVHYPTDVLGGAVLGLIFPSLITKKISLKIWEKIPKRILPLQMFNFFQYSSVSGSRHQNCNQNTDDCCYRKPT